MAYLFIVEGQAVIPTPEVLLTSPFKEIWDRDEDPNKDNARAEFKYMEFMTSSLRTNPYKGYSGIQKEIKIKEACGFDQDWTPDDLVQQGMEIIEEFQIEASENYQYYLSALKAAEELKKFFSTPNILKSVDDKGKPIYKPRDITSALKDTESIITNLNGLKNKVEEELFTKKKVRSDKKISPFAKKESFNRM